MLLVRIFGDTSPDGSVKGFIKTVMKKSPLTATSELKELLVKLEAQNYLVSIK